MSHLGALLLVPLLLAMWGLYRLGRVDRPGPPVPKFLVASLLVHVGLLFALDLILITVPVVESHRELIEEMVLRTFTIPSTRRPAPRPWEVLPDGPPPAERETAADSLEPVAAVRPFDPELRALTPTITVAEARDLPPARLLFVPATAPPIAVEASSALLPRAAAPPLLDGSAAELPALVAVPATPEPAPAPSVARIERRDEALAVREREPPAPLALAPGLPERVEGHAPPPRSPTLPFATEPPALPFERETSRWLLTDPVPHESPEPPSAVAGAPEAPLPDSTAAVERIPAGLAPSSRISNDLIGLPAAAIPPLATVSAPARGPMPVPDPVVPDVPLRTARRPLELDDPPPEVISPPLRSELSTPSPTEAATVPGRSALKDVADPRPRVVRPRDALGVVPPRLARERLQVAMAPRLDVGPRALPELRRPQLDEAPVALADDGLEITSGLVLRLSPARRDVVAAMGGSAASEAAVARGLQWLAAHQAAEGNWSLHTFPCKGHACDAAGSERSDAAATGLALMAFLGAGHLPGDGPHGEVVRRGLAWLVTRQKPDGDLAGPSGSQMYGHALATIALCEALALGGDEALRDSAARALKFIIEAQDPKSGGWRYRPRSGGDTSVVGWQLMALKSGEMAGLPVPAEVYERAGKWLDAVAAGPGRRLYAYTPGGRPSPAMTAEALLCRQYLGTPRRAQTMVAGGDYLKANLPRWNARDAYYWYYATQVMFHLQGELWALWNATLRDMLVGSQVHDGPAAGSWHPRQPSPDTYGARGGRLYETTLSLLMLEVYYRHLPLYQQLGPALPEETPTR